MKRLFFCLLAVLLLAGSAEAAMSYGASYYTARISNAGSGDSSDPLYLFINEVETIIEARTLEGGSTLTFANGLSIDNATDNKLEINENSDELILTFGSNTVTMSSGDVTLFSFGTIVVDLDQFKSNATTFTLPTADGTNGQVLTTNGSGTLSWAASAGTFTGGNITSDCTLSDGVDLQTTTTSGHAATLKVYDNDTGPGYTNVLSWTNGNVPAIAMGSDTSTFALNSTTIDIASGAVSGVTTLSTSGAVTVGGALSANSWDIGSGAFSTTGATTLGDGTSTVAISSTGMDVTTAGAVSNVTTLGMSGDLTNSGGDILLATGKGVKSSTTSTHTVGVYVYDNDTGPAYVGALVATNGNTPATVLGNTNGTTQIASSDWAISTAGAMTGIGAITADGLITGSAGATLSGATISLNANSNFAVNIGTGTSSGTVTIGGGSAAFAVASTGVDISTAGAISNVTTLSCTDDIDLANGKALKSSTTSGQTVKLKVYDNDTGPAYVDAVTLTNGNAPAVSIGGNVTTVAIDSTDWDIGATGDMTGIGAITADGLITGSLGLTITGATASLNASSNFGVNVCTGTSSGAVAIGGGSGTVAVTSSDWTISTAGAVTKLASVGFDSLSTVYYDTVELSNADIKALRASPKQLIAAPAAGSFTEVVSAVLILDYGSEVLTESTDNLVIQYNTSGTDITGAIEATDFIDAAADTICTVFPAAIPNTAAANMVARAVELFNTGDGEYGGNASNDTTMTVKIAYRVHPAGL